MLNKLIAGSPWRKTRFRDEKNNSISFFDLIYIVPAVLEKITAKFGRPIFRPIVNYTALQIFDKISSDDKSLLEYGSGRSTLWWARRLKQICSVESSQEWYDLMKEELEKNNLKNIEYVYSELNENYYMPLGNDGSQKKFDIIVVDGMLRDKCMEAAIKNYLAPNGIIYLDDSDKCSNIRIVGKDKNQVRNAENILRNWAFENDYYVFAVRNFSPTHLFVKEGVFAVPANAEYRELLKKYIA